MTKYEIRLILDEKQKKQVVKEAETIGLKPSAFVKMIVFKKLNEKGRKS